MGTQNNEGSRLECLWRKAGYQAHPTEDPSNPGLGAPSLLTVSFASLNFTDDLSSDYELLW